MCTIAPHRFPEEKRGANWDSSVRDNLTDDFTDLFGGEADAFLYVYAVMSCDSYLEVFEEELYQPADPERPPRVPWLQTLMCG